MGFERAFFWIAPLRRGRGTADLLALERSIIVSFGVSDRAKVRRFGVSKALGGSAF